MATLTYEPYDTTRVKPTFRSVITQFGDGYSQRTPLSINEMLETWELFYNLKTDADAQAVMDFFAAHSNGEVIEWIPPSEQIVRKFICVTYSRKYIHFTAVNAVTATLREVFE